MTKQLTLSQPGGQIMPTTLLRASSPGFLDFVTAMDYINVPSLIWPTLEARIVFLFGRIETEIYRPLKEQKGWIQSQIQIPFLLPQSKIQQTKIAITKI